MSRMEHHDKNNEQVFTRSTRTCSSDGLRRGRLESQASGPFVNRMISLLSSSDFKKLTKYENDADHRINRAYLKRCVGPGYGLFGKMNIAEALDVADFKDICSLRCLYSLPLSGCRRR